MQLVQAVVNAEVANSKQQKIFLYKNDSQMNFKSLP